MRIIKFRAWNEKEKTMVFNVAVRNSKQVLPIQTNGNDYWDADFEESNTVLMQFTGLFDRNGKEAYEGDIVKMFWQHDGVNCFDYDFIGEVEFCNEWCQFQVVQDKDGEIKTLPFHNFEREELIEFEIIGNVHENTDLPI